MDEKLSERRGMSVLVEASQLVRAIAEPRPAGDSVKAAISRALRRLPNAPHWTYSRVKAFWYRDDRCSVSAVEIEDLRRVAAKRTDKALVEGLDAIAARLDRTDSDFYRSDIAALRNITCRLRQSDCDAGS